MPNERKVLADAATFASCVLAVAGVVCLSAFAYFHYYYGWTGQRQFTSSAGAAIYYVLPAVLAILFFVSLRLKPAYRIFLAIWCLSLAASAHGVELLIYLSDSTVSAPKKPIMSILATSKERKKVAAKLSKQFGVDIDARDRQEVIADLRDGGIQAVPQIILPPLENQQVNGFKSDDTIDDFEVMPLGGIANRVTVVCNQNGEYLTYESDEHGFHNPTGAWRSDHMDIAAVGNSFTLGYCVPPDKNFVALIRKVYPATLNLGMPGEGPLHILGTLKEYASVFKPKLVLWFYCEGNSLPELQNEKRNHLLLRYLKDNFSQRLRERQPEVDQAVIGHIERQIVLEMSTAGRKDKTGGKLGDKLLELAKLSSLRRKLGMVYGTASQQLEASSEVELSELEADLNLFRNILSEARLRVNGWGGELYLIYLPSWGRYDNHPEIGVKAHKQVLSFVSALGIPLIDTYAAFQAHGDPLSLFPFRGPGHYNKEGHRLVAETVLNFISRRHPNSPDRRLSVRTSAEG